jgi:hypothetical protein
MDQKRFEDAVRSYWDVRVKQKERQDKDGKVDAGMRGAVTGGAQMDALAELVEEIFVDAGFSAETIYRQTHVELPGYFRPTKKWDLVVIHDGELAAAIEFKSHVGPSFGNNYNNRIEEAIGSATDVAVAFREGRLGKTQPWLGYFFLLEEHPKSIETVRVREPLFDAEDIFIGASYKLRYEILCRRLLSERLYDAVCFVTSSADPASPIHEPAGDLSFSSFVAQIRGRAAQLAAEAD